MDDCRFECDFFSGEICECFGAVDVRLLSDAASERCSLISARVKGTKEGTNGNRYSVEIRSWRVRSDI